MFVTKCGRFVWVEEDGYYVFNFDAGRHSPFYVAGYFSTLLELVRCE